MAHKTKTTELGTERRCNKCGEFWPDDAEFFFLKKGQPVQPCKACYYELPSVIAKRERQLSRRGARA